ncbi:MAG: hypothetical protein A2Y54_08580 [Chloroflexi bacterium RBG_16_51_16]|nr:MAG: hypothetical protein A2Y54_08580 [Chloroflexi bacterium RBG_16_51_16]
MNRKRIIEMSAYTMIFLGLTVISPSIAKLIDHQYYPYPRLFSESPLTLLMGGSIALIGFALVIWTIVIFKTIGKGTPYPYLPPLELVISGPYRYSRNPMVAGGFLALVGEAGIYQSPSLAVIAVLFAVILYVYIVFFEEPVLKDRFGMRYETYIKTVPRFLPNPFTSRRQSFDTNMKIDRDGK